MMTIHLNSSDHLEAMNEMKKMMQTPDTMKSWLETKRKEFDSLPESV